MRTRRLTMVATAGLLLAACGGGSDDASNDPAPAVVVDGADDAAVVLVDDTVDDAAVDIVVESGDPVDGAAGGDLVVDGDEAADGEAATDGTEEEQALAFAQCMRDEGVDWPDPVTNADGSIDLFGGVVGPGGGGIGEDAQGAIEVCGPLIEGASFLPTDGNPLEDPEFQDQLLQFAECLRGEGLDVDDPDFANFQPGAGGRNTLFGDRFDPDDPANADAINACSDIFAGGFGGGAN